MKLSKDRIQAVHTDPTLSIDDRIQALLTLGCDALELEIGIISQIVATRYTVMYSTSSKLKDQVFHFGNTYCSITLRQQPIRALGVPHFKISEYFRHPAYEAFALESYIGIPIYVNDEIYGTLNYSDPKPRQRMFSDIEKQGMKWLGDAIGALLDEKENLFASV